MIFCTASTAIRPLRANKILEMSSPAEFQLFSRKDDHQSAEARRMPISPMILDDPSVRMKSIGSHAAADQIHNYFYCSHRQIEQDTQVFV